MVTFAMPSLRIAFALLFAVVAVIVQSVTVVVQEVFLRFKAQATPPLWFSACYVPPMIVTLLAVPDAGVCIQPAPEAVPF